MALCRTCLGQLNLPVNLFNPNYKPLLDVLQLLLTFQVFLLEYEFNICRKCQEKLQGIHEFQSNCLKALQNIVDCTTENQTGIKESSAINPSYADHDSQSKSVVTTKELSLTVEKSVKRQKIARKKVLVVEERESSVQDNQDSGDDSPYNPAGEDNDSDSDYHCTESSKKRKRSVRVTRSNPNIEKNVQFDAHDRDLEQNIVFSENCRNSEDYKQTRKKRGLVNKKFEKLKQYPVDDVYKAIRDCNDAVNTTIDVEKLTCLICNFQAKLRRALTRHMLHSHKDTVSNWCRFCNILTDNLSQHEETTKCNEQRCKFCKMMYPNVYILKLHLKKHCDSKELDQILFAKESKLNTLLEPLVQYPEQRVLQAITECTAHTTELKYRSCLNCSYIGVRSRFLASHMGGHHKRYFKSWCGRCNLQTTDLKQHVDSTKCNEYPCVFCRVAKFKNAYELVSHLRLHCSELTNDERPDNNDDFQPDEKDIVPSVSDSVTPTNTSTTTVKSDLEMYLLGTSENEDLSNVDNNTVIPDVGIGERIGYNNWAVKRFPKEVVVQAIAELSNFTNDPKFKQCVLCRKHYTDSSYLRGHMKIRHKDQLLKWCINCNLITDDLNEHFNSIKCNIKKCILCSKIYPSYQGMRRHLNSHYKIDDSFESRKEKTICPICGNYYRNVSAHMYSNHKTDKKVEKVKCPQCGKMFKTLGSLKGHIRKHTEEKTIPCPVCGKNFYKRSEMKIHMEVHEGGPVQCTVCDKVLNRPGVLKLHMRQHTGENKHVCEQCGKSFHKKILLTLHMVSHSEERPYKCNFCDKRFKIIPTLRHHEQTHEGLRPYKCTFCSFKAVQAHPLTIHMKMHPEDAPQANNPHKCSFCHRSFSTNAVLQSHTDYIHGDNGNNRKKSYKKINPDDDDDNN